MWAARLLLAVAMVISTVSSQKLFFRSQKYLQKELEKDTVSAEINCPVNKSACPAGNTCCMTSAMVYGCCPLPNAMCCMDKMHCCPFGTRCDVSKRACISGRGMLTSWYERKPTIDLETQVNKEISMHAESVICPDGERHCADVQTCCKSAEGYLCCPLPHAVCCSDQIHCCPTGTKCDIPQGRCLNKKTGEFFVWIEKVPKMKSENQSYISKPVSILSALVSLHSGSVRCDDKHTCPTGNTCCKMENDEWGCCPEPQAVCCSDHVHCCPEGTTCDVAGEKCNRGDTQLDWFMKQPAIQVENVICPGSQECPNDNTCCVLPSGQYGCCPIPKAVCCSDHIHCCPTGTTCNVASGKCDQGNIQLDWFRKRPAILKPQDVICPDGSECQEGQTCCAMKHAIDEYGCCPHPNAVCCSDGEHCCPEGYRCDLSAGTCVRGTLTLSWIPTRNNHLWNNEITRTDQHTQNIVQRPGGKTCPDQNSSCDNGQGGYYCCAFPNGVCCDSRQYCCPRGYICGEQPDTCRIPETRASVSNFIRKLGFKKAIPHI